MELTAIFQGILADWVGARSADFEFPEGATYGDLLNEIGLQYRKNMPVQLWDHQNNCFRKQVRAHTNGIPFESPDTPLHQGEEIRFLLMIAGG